MSGVSNVAYADVEAMLDAEELAAAIVATPAHLNAEAALPCLERGVDTLLEKPPGMSLDQDPRSQRGR